MKKSKTIKNIEFSDRSILIFVSLIIVILLVSLLTQWQLFDKFTANNNPEKNKEIGSVGGHVTLQIIIPPDSSEEKNKGAVNQK